MTQEERIADFENLRKHFAKDITDDIQTKLTEMGFFTAPASTKYHGNYEGGLYDHSRAVFLRLQEITGRLRIIWDRPESPFIIGMFHDLCKCDEYKPVYESEPQALLTGGGDAVKYTTDVEQTGWKHADDCLLKGHGAKSVMLLSQLMQLTEEEVLCIRYHMGAYQTDDWKGFDIAIKKYQTVLWTHMADMLASKVDDV